jgi:uncharacterized protein
MELNNQFRVSVPIDAAWAVLTDLERIAPCMPGAELQEIEGDDYRGIVKVKVGPITAQYKGTARFLETDHVAHRAVLRAEGRDTRGQGNASATVTATATPDGDGTTVSIVTDLSITGKVAQFGRGVMGDISSNMLDEFAGRLEKDVLSQGSDAGTSTASKPSAAKAARAGVKDAAPQKAAASTKDTAPTESATKDSNEKVDAVSDEPAASTVRTVHSAPAEPVNLLGSAGPSVLKRGLPLVVVLGLIVLLWRRRRR